MEVTITLHQWDSLKYCGVKDNTSFSTSHLIVKYKCSKVSWTYKTNLIFKNSRKQKPWEMKDKILDSMVLKKLDPCTLHALSPVWTSNLSLVSDFLEDHFFINEMEVGKWFIYWRTCYTNTWVWILRTHRKKLGMVMYAYNHGLSREGQTGLETCKSLKLSSQAHQMGEFQV